VCSRLNTLNSIGQKMLNVQFSILNAQSASQ
jgi:hypothetical protein